MITELANIHEEIYEEVTELRTNLTEMISDEYPEYNFEQVQHIVECQAIHMSNEQFGERITQLMSEYNDYLGEIKQEIDEFYNNLFF